MSFQTNQTIGRFDVSISRCEWHLLPLVRVHNTESDESSRSRVGYWEDEGDLWATAYGLRDGLGANAEELDQVNMIMCGFGDDD